MSFDATTWVAELGFLRSFSIYAGALAIMTLGLPLVYIYGKRIRAFTAGKLDKKPVLVEDTAVATSTTGKEMDYETKTLKMTYSREGDGKLKLETSWSGDTPRGVAL